MPRTQKRPFSRKAEMKNSDARTATTSGTIAAHERPYGTPTFPPHARHLAGSMGPRHCFRSTLMPGRLQCGHGYILKFVDLGITFSATDGRAAQRVGHSCGRNCYPILLFFFHSNSNCSNSSGLRPHVSGIMQLKPPRTPLPLLPRPDD